MVIDDVPDGYADRLNPDWSSDATIAESVLVFVGNDSDDPVRDLMVELWSIAFGACAEFLRMVERQASQN